ncbi:hypothetical protein [Arthrobacter sp. Helios]|uniref:hypothetical protein n=1 Tax=Arthrobacter sp. Helios TaxID=2828862 RepID=UPI00206FE1FE|nr:hypothetical protein [Arthrobacter sp. Helios]UPO76980.1 hypothetical protein ArtHe_16915 [Arthrobacter sp. Helios]
MSGIFSPCRAVQAPGQGTDTIQGLKRRGIQAAVAALTAIGMMLVFTPPPASAVSRDALTNLGAVVGAPAPGFVPSGASVPVVDSSVGRGNPLGTDPSGAVHLGAAAEAHSAALVRLTMFEPAADATAYTSADTAVLHTRAGITASTTLLLPLVRGSVPLWADTAADTRLEVLAYFDGTEASGGATIALANPVRRADTSRNVGGGSLGQQPLWVGLTGEGSVSSTLARSVYAVLDVTLDRPDTVLLGDGQRLPLPAGRTIVSTIVDAEDQGGTTVALQTGGNSGSLTATVTGWVAEAGEDAAKTNHRGSYVVNTEQRNQVEVPVAAAEQPKPVALADDHDSAYALVLASAGGVAGGGTTTLSWGPRVSGRASGEAVDRVAGAQPQLALVPVTGGESQLSIRRGSAVAAVQPLGSFLGEPVPYDKTDPAAIEITSPRDSQSLDLTETGYFTLEGTVSTGINAVERIEISSPSVGFIGLAELNPVGGSITWSFRSLAPEDGDFDYAATVFDRSDPGAARASDRVRLTLDVAEEGDTVVSPEAEVFHLDTTELDFEVLTENLLRFTERPELEPGDIIVSAPVPSAPSGFLGRMSHMDLVSGAWEVATVEVPLEELFLQVDVDESVDYGEGEDVVAHDLLAQAGNPLDVVSGTFALQNEDGTSGPEIPVAEVEIVDDAGNPHSPAPGTYAEVVSGDDVDLELSSDEFNLDSPSDFSTSCRLAGTDGQEPRGEDIDENGEWVAPAAPAPGDGSCGGPLKGPGASLSADWTTKVDAGMVFVVENGVPKIRTAGKKQEPWEFESWAAKERGDEAGVAIRGGGELNLGFAFVLKTKLQFKWKVIPKGVSIEEFRIEFNSKLKASASVQAWVQTQSRWNVNLKVAEVALPTTTFMAGPVPVAITNRLNFAIAFTGTLRAEAEIPAIGIERADTFGFKYTSAAGMVRIKEDTPTKYVLPKPRQMAGNTSFSVEGEIAAGPEMSYQSRIYTFAGPDITLSAKSGYRAKLSTTGIPPTEAAIEASIFLALGLSGSAKLTLIRWELLSLTIFNVGARINLLEYKDEWKL